MKNNQTDIENNEIFNNIVFNKNEIKTEENFFNEIEDKNNDEDLSLDLSKSENSLSSDKLDLCDKSMEEQMKRVTLEDEFKFKFSKKITKEDLKTIPLPIFECFYCANEVIGFTHLINEKMGLNYLYNIEKRDIILIDFLINHNILDMYENKDNILNNFGMKNNIELYKIKSLVNVIFENTEYIKKMNCSSESIIYLKQKRFRENNDKMKNYNNNSSNNNIMNNKNINKENIQQCNNIFNFKEGKYGDNNIKIFNDDKSNDDSKNKIDNFKDEKSNDSFNRILDENLFMDLSRKIKKEDIIFEDKPYNIWENNIDDSFENES